MHTLGALLAVLTATMDPQLQRWLDEGREVPDEQAGRFTAEHATQLTEFTVMERTRALQDTLAQADLDALADDLTQVVQTTGERLEARRRAAFAACHLQRARSLPTLVGAGRQGPVPLREVAALCLGRYGNRRLAFHRELQKGDWRHVHFPEHFDEAARQAAITLADDPDAAVRSAAWAALSHFEVPELRPLAKRLMRERRVEPTFLAMLGGLGGKDVTAYLLAQTTHRDPEVRHAALAALEWRADELPPPTVVALLSDPDPGVEVAALQALRHQLRLPLQLPPFTPDRHALRTLATARLAKGFAPAPLDKRMPPEVDRALELRKAGQSLKAADQLLGIAKAAGARGDWRTQALALHRAGDAFADERDCLAGTDAYWQALVMHELRGDRYFTGVAANDLGLFYFKCGWVVGSNAPDLYEYVVALRREGDDKEALRKAVNNLSTSYIGFLLLDEARPVIAEALALARELGDPVAERKALVNEAHRQALVCTALAAVRSRVNPHGEGKPVPQACVQREDGTFWFKPDAEAELRAAVAAAVVAARKTQVDNAALCEGFQLPARFVCAWFPPDDPAGR